MQGKGLMSFFLFFFNSGDEIRRNTGLRKTLKNSFEKIVGKGQNGGNQHFLPFLPYQDNSLPDNCPLDNSPLPIPPGTIAPQDNTPPETITPWTIIPQRQPPRQ